MRETSATHEAMLKAIAQASAPLMDALRAAEALQLKSWCIGAGAVRNAVWDHLHGYQVSEALGEVDLVFFDSARPRSFEQEIQALLSQAHPRCSWDVTNQANVHRWYEQEFGKPVSSLRSLQDGVASWPEYATCVGLFLSESGLLEIVAPHGLGDLFALEVRHNPMRAPLAVAKERLHSKRWLQRWPKLQVLGSLANAA